MGLISKVRPRLNSNDDEGDNYREMRREKVFRTRTARGIEAPFTHNPEETGDEDYEDVQMMKKRNIVDLL